MRTSYTLAFCKDWNAVYNLRMAKKAKKMTLETLATHIDGRFEKIETLMERGFSAVAEDIGDIKHGITKLATKEGVVVVHEQVNSVESQLRGMKYIKLEGRIADVEEKLFGKVRA